MMMKRGKGKNSKLLPNSLRIISSCIKNVSTNASTAVRNAAAYISSSADEHKDQVIWAGFDKLEVGLSALKHVLLLGYQNGFQVIDVEDASNFSELVSKRTGPVTFLQMLPAPVENDGIDKLSVSRPLLLVVGGDGEQRPNMTSNQSYLAKSVRDGTVQSQFGNHVNLPTVVQFYSLRSNSYEQVLRFHSAVLMIKCSPRIIAVGLEAQIYCFSTLTLEKKFSVVTYPVPNFEGHGSTGVNTVCGPMALGPRWLAYAPKCPLLSNTGRLSPKNISPSGDSTSNSLANGNFVANYAMESGKQLAAGIISMGDMGYKTLSKYCGDLLPDGHNSPGWKLGKLTASEMENAGTVIVKDVVSTEVISQFRAHTSPISALSFDESGTLLVTASVHGNNLNIFRIMPSSMSRGSGFSDFNCSHVHLYKLHRGITKAIIQDISFSHYSQWITIISTKGTCHIFVISPFGGDAGLQTLPHEEGATLYPVTSSPWWSTSSFTINRKYSLPPSPLTLSVVSRIRNNFSGLLSSVSSAASSAIGKALVPSGAIVAVFHNCIPRDIQNGQINGRSLEHLLVYTHSGFVIQYVLFPSIGEVSDNSSKSRSGASMHAQEEDPRVKAEPVQWWDVCRRSDGLEREECIFGTIFDSNDNPESSDHSRARLPKRPEENTSVGNIKRALDRSHWCLSNAEVQISSDILPIWLKSKMRFFAMSPLMMEHMVGESEIEKVPFHEVELKQKDLLPVFTQLHSVGSGWMNRGFDDGSYPDTSSLETCKARDNTDEATIICHSEPASLGSTESSDAGSSTRTENLLDLDQITSDKSPTRSGHNCNGFYEDYKGSTNLEACGRRQKSGSTQTFSSDCSLSSISDTVGSTGNKSFSRESMSGLPAANTGGRANDCPPSASKILKDVSLPFDVMKSVNFKQIYQEGYYNMSELDREYKSTEGVEFQTQNSPSDRENTEDDKLLCGMFGISEEVD